MPGKHGAGVFAWMELRERWSCHDRQETRGMFNRRIHQSSLQQKEQEHIWRNMKTLSHLLQTRINFLHTSILLVSLTNQTSISRRRLFFLRVRSPCLPIHALPHKTSARLSCTKTRGSVSVSSLLSFHSGPRLWRYWRLCEDRVSSLFCLAVLAIKTCFVLTVVSYLNKQLMTCRWLSFAQLRHSIDVIARWFHRTCDSSMTSHINFISWRHLTSTVEADQWTSV